MGSYRAPKGCAEAKISQWSHYIRGLDNPSWVPYLNWLREKIVFIGRCLLEGKLRQLIELRTR